MKELLKNKWAWAVLVLVLINVATIGAMWCSMCGRDRHAEHHRHAMHHHGEHGRGGNKFDHMNHSKGEDFLSRELNLSEEQKASFEALRKEHFQKMKVNVDSMQALKKVMVKSLGKTEAEINGTLQKIGALEITIQKETFDHFNKMYALCTDSQKTLLKEKLENVTAHHGPRFGHKRADENVCDTNHQVHGVKKSCCSMAPKRF